MTEPNPRRWWLVTLICAVIVSVTGNVGHALLTAPEALRTYAAGAAALPPIAFLGVTEGLARTAGAGVRQRRIYRFGIAGAVVIALLAFVLSFAAQRDLAIALGQPAAVAAGWPLLADATIAVSSTMLLALRPYTDTVDGELRLVGDDGLFGVTSDDPHRVLAERLVMTGAVKAGAASVVAALDALAAGRSLRSVAATTGLHRSTVARIAEARLEAETEAEVAG